MMSSPLGRLRLCGLAEGASFVVLLGVAMPLKYLAGIPLAVRIVGAVHGALFVLLVILIVRAVAEMDFPWSKAAKVFFAALVPFGPFLIDGWLRREERQARLHRPPS